MATTYAEVFGSNLRVQEELDHFLAHVVGDGGDGARPVRESVAPVQSTGRFDLRSSRNKAFALWMVLRAEKHGSAQEADALARLLGQKGAYALPAVSEEDEAQLPDGRVLLDPRDLDAFRAKLRAPSKVSDAFLGRYVLSQKAIDAFRRGDDEEFLKERRVLIDEGEAEFSKSLGLRWLLDEPIDDRSSSSPSG